MKTGLKIATAPFGLNVASGQLILSSPTDTSKIPDEAFFHSTGTTAKGAPVNSLRIAYDGGTIVLRGENGDVAAKADDLEIVSIDVLVGLGYQVTPPTDQN